MKNNVVCYFPNTDLRSGHKGLSALARKEGHNTKMLANGDFLVFLNSKKTAFKLFASGNIVVHYKSDAGRVDLRALQYLPLAFRGGRFNFNAAIRVVLEKDLAQRKAGFVK